MALQSRLELVRIKYQHIALNSKGYEETGNRQDTPEIVNSGNGTLITKQAGEMNELTV